VKNDLNEYFSSPVFKRSEIDEISSINKNSSNYRSGPFEFISDKLNFERKKTILNT
jgi:hypothetical protein